MGRGKRKPRKSPCGVNLAEESTAIEVTATRNLVDISSRLSLPVTINQGIESDDETDDEDTVEFDFRPRKTFLSNTCLVCSRLCSPEYLCKNCEMVSYCSDDHRGHDAAPHRGLCETLRKYHRDDGFRGDSEGYRIFRVGVIAGAESSLGRCLEPWEKEIVLYPRACFKCHRGGDGLRCCEGCKVVFRCATNEDAKGHSEWCLEYKIFREVVAARNACGNYAEPRIPSVYLTAAPYLAANNFDTIMSMVNNNSGNFPEMDVYNYTALSHLASIPLTALYAFQESRGDWKRAKSITVHLIGAEFQYEGVNLRVWEKLFLHFIPGIKNLRLVITGPELLLPDVQPPELLTRVKICPRCRSAGRRIRVEFVPRTLYHDYATSSGYDKPDLACLFNPGLYRRTGFDGRDTWPDTIYQLCRSRAPILVTAYTEREIPMDIERIVSVRPDVEVVLTPRRNPFASLKPDRNFVSDESAPLIYKNYFLSIVKAP